MTNQSNNKKKRRGIAFGLAGLVLASGAFAGATFANLNANINDGSDSSHVYSEEFNKFGFVYHEASGVFDKDISVTDGMSFNRDVKNFVVTNKGDIPAQYAFAAKDVPVLDAENPIWDETYVLVNMNTDSAVVDQWAGTFREFTETAFVSNDVLKPGEDVAVTVHILPPTTYTWSSDKSAAPVDINFGTQFTFNQLTTPVSSPLLDYARENGEQRGGMLKPELNEYFNQQVTSNMTSVVTIPAADLEKITL